MKGDVLTTRTARGASIFTADVDVSRGGGVGGGFTWEMHIIAEFKKNKKNKTKHPTWFSKNVTAQ